MTVQCLFVCQEEKEAATQILSWLDTPAEAAKEFLSTAMKANDVGAVVDALGACAESDDGDSNTDTAEASQWLQEQASQQLEVAMEGDDLAAFEAALALGVRALEAAATAGHVNDANDTNADNAAGDGAGDSAVLSVALSMALSMARAFRGSIELNAEVFGMLEHLDLVDEALKKAAKVGLAFGSLKVITEAYEKQISLVSECEEMYGRAAALEPAPPTTLRAVHRLLKEFPRSSSPRGNSHHTKVAKPASAPAARTPPRTLLR